VEDHFKSQILGGLCLKVGEVVCVTETLSLSTDPRDFNTVGCGRLSASDL
jgi:hypothetical protein